MTEQYAPFPQVGLLFVVPPVGGARHVDHVTIRVETHNSIPVTPRHFQILYRVSPVGGSTDGNTALFVTPWPPWLQRPVAEGNDDVMMII